MTRSSASPCLTVRAIALVSTVWVAVVWVTAGAVDASLLTRPAAAVRRRLDRLRTGRDAGLTTVEVAVITAVLLGLATALVAAITVVVNRNTSKIR